MEPWLKISLILCVFGVLKEFRPSEPFITEFFLSPPMNFTKEDVSQDIYPIGIYANLVELVIVFLITDFLRYKIVIVFASLSYLTVYIILISFRSLAWMQMTQIFYGFGMAGEVAYYSYIYAKVDKEHFQEVTSHTRCAYLIGRMLSGISSQVIISFQLLTYFQLQYVTIGGATLATLWALNLPKVENSIYFHRKVNIASSSIASITSDTHDLTYEIRRGVKGVKRPPCKDVFRMMWTDIKYAFTDLFVLQLLIWFVLASSCYYQALSYVQLLWNDISNSNADVEQSLWNGAVETSYTLLGALATFFAGKVNISWNVFGNHVLSINTLLMAVMFFIMSQTNLLWVAYATIILSNVIYQATITFVTSEIAKNLKEDSYGLIFGVAMFLSLAMQTLLTVVFVSGKGLGLPPRLQFIVYGGYISVLGVIFTVKAIYSTLHRFCCNKNDLFDRETMSSHL